MATAKRRSRKPHSAPAAATVEPKASTFRLRPALKSGLEVLGRVQRKPLNRLINEAVEGLLEKGAAEIEADLKRVRAYRQKDPAFESAIEQFVDAEASLGRNDPMEGKPSPAAGPAQTKIRNLLRG